jgi:hypothetical protein
VPLVGQVPSAALVLVQSPPIIARFTASNRRNVAQFKKFPSHSVSGQAVANAVLPVPLSNRVSVVL